MEDFITPANHINFLAKKIFGNLEQKMLDGSIAYLDKEGGGPVEMHTHDHNHLFMVVKGEVKIMLGDKVVILSENDVYLVKGKIPHSVWNNREEVAVMVGISTKDID